MKKKKERPKINVPALLRSESSAEVFRPTRACQQMVWAWTFQHKPEVRKQLLGNKLGEETDKLYSRTQILEFLGYSRQNLYAWQKHSSFEKWYRTTVEELIKGVTLPEVYANLGRRAARTHDTSMIKLFLDKFDEAFSPKSSLDNKHSFKGYLPGEQQELAEASRARERELVPGPSDEAKGESKRKKVETSIADQPQVEHLAKDLKL